MPSKWRIAIPLAVVVVVLVGALAWMFASDDSGPAKGKGGGKGGGGQAQPAATTSTIPGAGKDTGLDAPVTGDLVLYGVPTTRAALNGLKAGFEAANPDVNVEVVVGSVLDLVAAIVEDPRPGAVIVPERAMDAVKGVSGDVGDAAELGRNLFVVAVPKGNPKGIEGLDALAAGTELRVIACGPDSPYGNFAQLVLDEAEVEVDDGVVKSGCGNDAIKQLATDQLDAALVMRTAKNRTVQSVPVPEDANIVINVEIAPVGDSAEAAALLTYAASEAGTSILTDRGFLP